MPNGVTPNPGTNFLADESGFPYWSASAASCKSINGKTPKVASTRDREMGPANEKNIYQGRYRIFLECVTNSTPIVEMLPVLVSPKAGIFSETGKVSIITSS